jgi:hypothetical protein
MIRALSDVVHWLESQSPENLESDIPKLPVRFAEEEELTEEQIILLKEMIKMFDRYHDSKMSLQYLKGILNLLSNPDSEIIIPPSERGAGKSLFLFEEKMSVRQIIELILGLVKLRNIKTDPKYLPKYRTIIQKKYFKKGS